MGDIKGRTAIIIGVARGALWRYEEHPPEEDEDEEEEQQHRQHRAKVVEKAKGKWEPMGAAPFQGETKHGIDQLHQLTVVGSGVTVRSHDPFAFLTSRGVVRLFDISAATCEQQYHVRHGERYAVPPRPAGDDAHMLPWSGILTIIGVFDGHLWWAADRSGSSIFPDKDDDGDVQKFRVRDLSRAVHVDVRQQWGLRLLYTTTVRPYSPEDSIRVQARWGDGAGDQSTGRNLLCLDVSNGTMEPYGCQHGDGVVLGAGPRHGEMTTVAGVCRNRLYVLARTAGLTEALPGFGAVDTVRVNMMRKVGVKQHQQQQDAEGSQFRPFPIDGRALQGAQRQLFRYLGPAGGVSLFDRSESALLPWQLHHADRLILRSGALKGREAVIIGVRGGLLSWDIDDAGVATPASGCARRDQLDELCNPVVLGTAGIREFVG